MDHKRWQRPGRTRRTKLVGCHITQNGNVYQFTKPNINDVLSTVTISPPTGAFNFPQFNYKDVNNWGITSNPLVPGQNALGSWVVPANPMKRTGQQGGTYTATADGTYADADEAASSAKA